MIQRGEPGQFDCHWIQTTPSIVTWKDRHWLYYAGLARSHDVQWSLGISGPEGGIGLATIRRDGFISLSAGAQSASVTTKLLTFRGNRLTINAVTAATASVRVEIQDATGKPLLGFTLADSTEIIGDEIEGIVQWKDDRDVSRLARKPVRLRFVLCNADMFSLKFESTDAGAERAEENPVHMREWHSANTCRQRR